MLRQSTSEVGKHGSSDDATKSSYESMQLKYPIGCNRFEDVKSYYAEWAPTYGKDMKVLGYQDPLEITEFVMKRFGRNFYSDELKILDIGSGPGNVGICMRKMGYRGTIHALDYSQHMLDQIPKNVYNMEILHAMVPNTNLPNNELYDVITLAGTIGPSTMHPACLKNVVKAIKPRGYLIATTRSTYENEPAFHDKIVLNLNGLVTDGECTKIHEFEFNHYEWKEANQEKRMKGIFHAYQVLS